MKNYVWNVASGNFGAQSSWNPNGIPTTSDATNIGVTTSLFGSGSALFLNIYNAITVTISAALTTDIANDVLIGGGAAVGQTPAVVDVDAAWTDSSEISVGQDGFGTGELFVNSGGSLSAANINIGTNFSKQTPDYTGAMTVQDGGVVNTTGGYDEVGVWQGGTGTLTVTGLGSSWTSSGTLNIGDTGTGTLYVENGAKLNAVNLNTGVNYDQQTIASGSGTTYIESGGVVTTTGAYQEIGADASGSSADVTEGATGAVTVDGAGSEWNAENGAIEIGDVGSKFGSLTISDGGKVTAGAEIDIGNEFNGADGSYGTLLIESGGTAVTGGYNFGNGAYYDSVGAYWAGAPTSTATVTGSGSSWRMDAFLDIDDSGEVFATSGGSIEAAQGINLYAGSLLQVDSSSSFEVGNTGNAAAGYLTVDAVSVNGDASVYGDGTIDADTINNGTFYADDGVLTINGSTGGIGTISGTGRLLIGAQATLALNASVASSQTVTFAGWDGTLALGDPAAFAAPIKNFNAGDTIDLEGLTYAGTPSTYTFTPSGSKGGGTLVVTEGSAHITLQIASSPQSISGELTLSEDASRTGTDVAFTNGAAQAPFQIWSSLGSFFNTTSGAVNGEDYGQSTVTDGGTPIWMETETPASGYVSGSGAPENYTIVLATQDWLGDIQPEITIATDSHFVDPFVNNVLSSGNLAAATMFSTTSAQGSGGIVYWTASATPGDYSVDFEPFNVTYPDAPPTSDLVQTTGPAVQMISTIANPLSWNVASQTSNSFVFAYMAAASSTTENLYMEAFNASGVATSAGPTLAVSNLPDGTPYRIYYHDGGYGYQYLEVGGALGTGMISGSFSTSSNNPVGSPSVTISLPAYTAFDGIAAYTFSNDNVLHTVEGVENNQAVIQTFLNSNSTATATFELSAPDDHFATTDVYDINDGAMDYIVLAYTDAGKVHLELLNNYGVQIGGDYVVPGISSFLHLNTMQGSSNPASTRVELDYAVANPNGGQEIEGLIFDTAGVGATNTLSGGGLYSGTPFNDTFNWGAGIYTAEGGGGADTFAVPESADQVALSIDASGDVVVQTYTDSTLTSLTGSTTLIDFTYVQMKDSEITISPTSNGEALTISAGGLLQLARSTPSNDTIAFSPGGGELAIEGGASVGGTVEGFAAPDKIDLAGLQYDQSESSYSVVEVGNTDVYDVTVKEGSSSFSLNFEQSTPVTNQEFALKADSGTGTELTAACYRVGTRILTERGDVAIEHLAIGDLVVTASGTRRPIVWLGHRKLSCARHPSPRDVWPVRVSAGAFEDNRPRRDLWLSPGHNIAWGGALIPISALLNGTTVAQIETPTVEYWHVELDAHDVILAEGLPAESYLDTGNRTAFANGGAFIEAHPDFRPKASAQTCLPLITQGPEVAHARAHLFRQLPRLDFEITTDADPHMLADGRRIEPTWLDERRFALEPPPGSRAISLRSRTFVPAYSPLANGDMRELGLSVARLQIDGVYFSLDDWRLEAGWRVCEREDGRPVRRWTDGAAALPKGAKRVVIDLAGEGLYWTEPAASRAFRPSSFACA